MKKDNRYFAIIGDIIRSRKLPNRQLIQNILRKTIEEINHTFKEKIVSEFVLTIGDEFQAIVCLEFPFREFFLYYDKLTSEKFSTRFSLGIGGLSTDINVVALEMDGPCLHSARNALEEAKIQKERVIVKGYDCKNREDFINACFSLTNSIEDSWTNRQRELIENIRMGLTQYALAAKLKVTRQAVWRQLLLAAWAEYKEGWSAISKWINPQEKSSRTESLEIIELLMKGLEKRLTKIQKQFLELWYTEGSQKKVARIMDTKHRTVSKILRAAHYASFAKGKDFFERKQ